MNLSQVYSKSNRHSKGMLVVKSYKTNREKVTFFYQI